MKSFRLFVEGSDVRAFLASMIQHRFDHTPRVISADYFDENGFPALAELIRYTQNVHTNGFSPEEEKDFKSFNKWNQLVPAAAREVKHNGASVDMTSTTNPTVSDDTGTFRLGAKSIQRHARSQWVDVPLSRISIGVVLGMIMLISSHMFHSRSNQDNYTDEVGNRLEQAQRELTDAYWQVSRQGNRYQQVDLAKIKRLTAALTEFGHLIAHDTRPRNGVGHKEMLTTWQTQLKDIASRRIMINARKPWSDLLSALQYAISAAKS